MRQVKLVVINGVGMVVGVVQNEIRNNTIVGDLVMKDVMQIVPQGNDEISFEPYMGYFADTTADVVFGAAAVISIQKPNELMLNNYNDIFVKEDTAPKFILPDNNIITR